MDQWVGIFAVPTGGNLAALPEALRTKYPNVVLTDWTYGQTAEILHVGPYEKEAPTVAQLKAFLDENGFQVAGAHEEEYVKGPGMFGPGNPQDYLTIIRYPVQKKLPSE